ncbi:MAG: hypothetical protein MUP81_00515 [Dehalococcoidia bacterium]|nr:hypothetical protein [Dehalococcoidia bacterium]
MPAPLRPIIPGDWMGLEQVIKDLWGIVNADTSLSDMVADDAALSDAVVVNTSDIVILKSDMTSEKSDTLIFKSDIVVLKSDVTTNASDIAVVAAAAATIGGSDTQVQYNNGGDLGGASGLTYNDGTNVTTATEIDVTGTATTKRLLAGGVQV